MKKEFKVIMNVESLIGETDIKEINKFVDIDKATTAIPSWYRDLAPHTEGTSHSMSGLDPINDRGSDGSDVSTKLCVPYLDAMTMGYVYKLTEDVEVSLSAAGTPTLKWKKRSNLLDIRHVVDSSIPSDCHPIQFGIRMHAYYQTPEGYSTLICHPFNRFDLPFQVPAGLVDSDIWGLAIFVPFYLKRDFIGTIPKGTPMFQMIPVKRDEWELKLDSSRESYEEHTIKEEKRRTRITAYYKQDIHQKKSY